MVKKVLVTGANGFIGKIMQSYLSLKPDKYQVHLLTRAHHTCSQNTYVCDLLNKTQLQSVLEKIQPDWVLHLAGGRSFSIEDLQENEKIISNLFQVIDSIGLSPRIIVPGTAAEYGRVAEKDLPIVEEYHPNPKNDYGRSKWRQTQIALDYTHKGGDVVIGRIFNILGKDTPAELVAGSFAKQIVRIENGQQENIQTMGLEGKRDFIDGTDVTRALIDLAEFGHSGEVYNICSGNLFSIRDLLNEMIRFSTAEIEVRENVSSGTGGFDVYGSCRKLQELSGWQPIVPFTESIKQTIQSYRT